MTPAQQLDVVFQIAVRRDNHTRYARLREWQKEIRAQTNENISRTRVLTAMRAMQSIVQGEHGSVQEALDYHGVKHIPEYYREELQKMWATASRK